MVGAETFRALMDSILDIGAIERLVLRTRPLLEIFAECQAAAVGGVFASI